MNLRAIFQTSNVSDSNDEIRTCEENGNEQECSICLNINSYATKKSVGQGMIDIALLSANCTQLKAILTVGWSYQFYTAMLTLVMSSIVLQVLQAILIMYLSFKCNINKARSHKKAVFCNNIVTSLTTTTMAVNVIISVFDIQDSARK